MSVMVNGLQGGMYVCMSGNEVSEVYHAGVYTLASRQEELATGWKMLGLGLGWLGPR
jgi:hypothetical protein